MAFKAIPVVAGKVAATLSDYPAYIKPSAMTGWEVLTLAEAQSIRFYSDEAKTTELAREVVSADEVHVKVPSLTTSTTIYADYDGVRSDLSPGATYGRNAVWGDYMYVSHNGGGDDATGNSNTGTANGGVTLGGATGQIGNATDYDGTDDYSNIGFQEFGAELASFTYQQWLKTSETSTDAALSGTLNDGNTGAYLLRLNTESNAIGFFIRQDNQPITSRRVTFLTNTTVNDNVWHQLHLVVEDYATRDGQWYIDGSSVTTTASGTSSLSNIFNNFQYNVYVGAFNNRDSADRHGNIIQEEIRVRKGINNLSANWIETEYNNQDDVASFWGTVTDVGATATLGLKLGSTTINKVMLGSTEIKKIYLGTTVIYENL